MAQLSNKTVLVKIQEAFQGRRFSLGSLLRTLRDSGLVSDSYSSKNLSQHMSALEGEGFVRRESKGIYVYIGKGVVAGVAGDVKEGAEQLELDLGGGDLEDRRNVLNKTAQMYEENIKSMVEEVEDLRDRRASLRREMEERLKELEEEENTWVSEIKDNKDKMLDCLGRAGRIEAHLEKKRKLEEEEKELLGL